MNYTKAARRIWKPTEWVHGCGPHAVVAFCNVTTVTLHQTDEDAQGSKAFIDLLGCGHQGYRDHVAIDLRAAVR